MTYDISEKVTQDKNDSIYSETVCQKYLSCRWTLAYLCFTGRLVQYTIRQGMSMAMVCITPDLSDSIPATGNSSCITLKTESNNITGTCIESNETGTFTVDWSNEEKGIVYASYFYGFTISTLIGGYLTEKVSYKLVIGLSMVMCAISTLITPLGIITNLQLVITLRAMVGLFQGLSASGFKGIWGTWAPKHERTQLSTVTYSGTDIGNIVAFGASGYLCHASLWGGWPLIFYTFGSMNMLWAFFWFFYAFDSPDSHPRISDEEKLNIKSHTNDNTKKKAVSIPWLKIMTSLPVWGILIAAICNSWVNVILQMMLPTYMRYVLKYNTKQNGMVSMLPFISRFIAHISLSFLADFILQKNIFKTATVRKVFQCTGFLIPAGMLVVVSSLDYKNRSVAVILFIILNTFNSFSDVAFRVNHLDIAPKFASLIAGMTLSFSQLAGIFVPYIKSILTPNETQEEWQRVFISCAGVYVFGSIIFTLFAEGEEQEWSLEASEEPDRGITDVGRKGRFSFSSEEQNTKDRV